MGQDELDAFMEIQAFLQGAAPSIKFSFKKNVERGFRKKAKLVVSGTIDKPLIGLYFPASHEVVDVGCCVAHHPQIQTLIQDLKMWIIQEKIVPYQEKLDVGVLRYVQILVNEKGQIQLTLVMNELLDDPRVYHALINRNSSIVSLWCNIQKKKTNTILSSHFEHITRDVFLAIEILEKTYYFHPGAFAQNDYLMFSHLLDEVGQQLSPGGLALDLYAGMGLFGLSFEHLFERIYFAETNRFAQLSYEETIEKLGFEKGTYFLEEAKNVLPRYLTADCIFVDPPRKGLEKTIKPILAQMKPQSTLVYISCGYRSLLRDLKELLELGFSLEWIKGYDCFPKTGEIEAACILKKNL